MKKEKNIIIFELQIKNWSKFQHYTKRNPPWIKLHRDLIDEPSNAIRWRELSGEAAKLLVELWLTASKSDNNGKINYASNALAYGLHRSEKEICNLLKELIFNEWIEGDIEEACRTLATRYTEKRREETEIREEKRRVLLGAENLEENDPLAQIVITIPLTQGNECCITRKQLYDWTDSYPSVDVAQALREIREWNLGNPKKRKTMSGIRNHITSWLAKEQNKGTPRSIITKSYIKPKSGKSNLDALERYQNGIRKRTETNDDSKIIDIAGDSISRSNG